jgi:hypothetical protein
VVIPDLTRSELNSSSLLLGGRVLDNPANKEGAAQVQLSVDHQFARSSKLDYWVFVYNAKRDGGGNPNLIVKSEVLRDGQIVATAPQRTIKNGAPDPQRIPFGDQLPLRSLSPGRYDLLVTIIDTLAGTQVTQTVDFQVL